MRNIFHFQAEIGSLPIEDIRIDPKSRDDIPALLSGLQYLYTNEKTRAELFDLLEKEALPDVNLTVGRPGMTLWGILVMGVLKQGLGCDFDRLHELVNQHKTIQAFLGHGSFAPEYRRQQVIDNVHLLSPTVLSKVGQWVVNAGHRVSKKSLACRCAGGVNALSIKTKACILPNPVLHGIRGATDSTVSSGKRHKFSMEWTPPSLVRQDHDAAVRRWAF